MQLTAFSSKSRNVTKRSTAITSHVLNYTSGSEHSDLEQRSVFALTLFFTNATSRISTKLVTVIK